VPAGPRPTGQNWPPMSVLPATHIEIIRPVAARGRVRSVLLDFDGTLSLIREGWQQVMVPMMVEVLRETPRCEDEETVAGVAAAFVEELTGKQTIYQMIRLGEEVEKRGGAACDPLDYKREYLRRLSERIKDRLADLESGRAQPDDFLVPGARPFLEGLVARGASLYLASGTDHADVLREATLLDLPRYFGDRIFGARDRYWEFSKAKLIEEMLRTHDLRGPELLGVGDGFVEIENTRAAGGTAIGVASDEARREGVDEWKRRRLTAAGADIIIPDFREHEALLGYLWGEA
jgi:phosphoglycolate phosphatase